MVKNCGPYKDEIIRLYENHNVDDLVEMMKDRGFTASRRWYLTKFAEWGCQKTSNRKPIQKRKRTPVEEELEENGVETQLLNSPPPLNEVSPQPPGVIDVCPYPSCASGPFAEVQDYLDHEATHKASILNALAWEGPTQPPARDLKEYLRLRVLYTREEVAFIYPDLDFRVFQSDSYSITQLDVVECLEVLLDTGRGLYPSLDHLVDINACSIKAIVGGEVDFTGAERTLRLLLEAIRLLSEGPEPKYPPAIEWLHPLQLSSDWGRVKESLYMLDDDSRVLSPFDRYIPTFIIQTYIQLVHTESIAVPISFDVEILAICEKLDIPLDVKYLSIVQKLPREPESQTSSLDADSSAWSITHSELGVHNQEDSVDACGEVEEVMNPGSSLPNGWRYHDSLSCGCAVPVPIRYGQLRHKCQRCSRELFLCGGSLKYGGDWGCGQRFIDSYAMVGHAFGPGKFCIKSLLDEKELGECLDQTGGRAPRNDMHQEQQDSRVTLPIHPGGWATYPQVDQKRHKDLHSGEKKIVCKGKLKDGSQWGCGRRFARVDSLGRHIRSADGQACIKPLFDEEVAQKQILQDQPENSQQAPVAGGQPNGQGTKSDGKRYKAGIFINGKKVACAPCIRGHRTSKCEHANERPLVEVRRPGRPLTDETDANGNLLLPVALLA